MSGAHRARVARRTRASSGSASGSHTGAGCYEVQSHSSWFPFDKCPTNDKIRDAAYGNEERRAQGFQPQPPPLQCLYMVGTPEDPEYIKPGTLPGDLVLLGEYGGMDPGDLHPVCRGVQADVLP